MNVPLFGGVPEIAPWVAKSDWFEDYRACWEEHFGIVAREFDVDEVGVERLLETDRYSRFTASVVEHFMSIRFDGGQTVVDAYLKSPTGRKLPDDTKARLRAIRDSLLSLYEVQEVRPGKEFVLNDLLQRGKPITVLDDGIGDSLSVGEWIAGRVLEVGKNRVLSHTWLPFRAKEPAPLIDDIRIRVSGASKAARKDSKGIYWDLDIQRQALADVAPTITSFWLVQELGPLVGNDTWDSDDTELIISSFEIPGDRHEEVERRLDAATLLRKHDLGWWWLGSNPQEEDPDRDEMDYAGSVIIDDEGNLSTEVTSEFLSYEIQGYIMGILDGIVGPPETRFISSDDLANALANFDGEEEDE